MTTLTEKTYNDIKEHAQKHFPGLSDEAITVLTRFTAYEVQKVANSLIQKLASTSQRLVQNVFDSKQEVGRQVHPDAIWYMYALICGALHDKDGQMDDVRHACTDAFGLKYTKLENDEIGAHPEFFPDAVYKQAQEAMTKLAMDKAADAARAVGLPESIVELLEVLKRAGASVQVIDISGPDKG